MANLPTSYQPQDIGLLMMPKSMTDAMQLAEMLSRSTFIPKDYQRNPPNILAAILKGARLGLDPMQAMDGICLINGRASLWGDALLGVVWASGLLEVFRETQTDTEATCTVKRKGMEEVSVTFTKADAERAGLWGKNIWKQYPKRMLQNRARGWALRDNFADVLRGIRMAEEERDIIIANSREGEVVNLPLAPDEPLALNPAPTVEAEPEPLMTSDQATLIKSLVKQLGWSGEEAADVLWERYQTRLKMLTEQQAEDFVNYLSEKAGDLVGDEPPPPGSPLAIQQEKEALANSAAFEADRAAGKVPA